jgi:hypothetical protein
MPLLKNFGQIGKTMDGAIFHLNRQGLSSIRKPFELEQLEMPI